MADGKMEKAFVFAAKNGNPKSFEELYKLHCQEIYAIALTITRRKNEAEEVLRATFAAAWQELEALEESEDFGMWLRDIARRKCDELAAEKQRTQQVIEEELLTDSELQDMAIPTALAMDIFQQVFRQGAESVTVTTVPFPEITEPPVIETPSAPVAESVGAPPAQASVPAGGGSSAAGAASASVKSTVPLWTKIAAGVLGATIVAGGGIAAYQTFTKQSDPIASAAVGDEINFGTYEQDNDPENGEENITWRVLEREDNKLFVVSKYVLDSASYDDFCSDSIWRNTGMRQKLNGSFYTTAFSEEEQKLICDAYVLSEDTWGQKKDDDISVEKVFLLSQYEVQNYFSSDDDRAALATEYAAANGARTDEHNRAVWWTRSVVFENDQGAVYENGDNSAERGGHSGDRFGIRPAMWIDTKAIAEDGEAREVVQPLNTKRLPKSLNLFLCNFALHYCDGTFNCETINQTNNILYGVIGERECVDYAVYSDKLAEENERKNWVVTKETPSPIPAINEKSNFYKILDAEPVDDILKQIFNCTDNDIQKMRGMQFPTNPYGYADGKYYCATDGNGGLALKFEYEDCESINGRYYYTLTFYPEGYDNPNYPTTPDSPVTMYVATKLLAHEGKPWWSLYYYSKEPFFENEDIKKKPEEASSSAIKPDKEDTTQKATEVLSTDKPAVASTTVEPTKKSENSGIFREYTQYAYNDEFEYNTTIKLNDETSFTGHYEKSAGSEIYTCDFHGKLGSFQKQSEYVYKADILSMESDRPAGTEKIGNITYHYIDASEVYRVELRLLRVFTPDAPNTSVTKRIIRHVHPDGNTASGKIDVYYLLINDMYGLIQKD